MHGRVPPCRAFATPAELPCEIEDAADADPTFEDRYEGGGRNVSGKMGWLAVRKYPDTLERLEKLAGGVSDAGGRVAEFHGIE
jgi:hypothetical protein